MEGIGPQVFILVAAGNNYNQQVLERSLTFRKNASALFQVIFQVPELPERIAISLFEPLAQIHPLQNRGDYNSI